MMDKNDCSSHVAELLYNTSNYVAKHIRKTNNMALAVMLLIVVSPMYESMPTYSYADNGMSTHRAKTGFPPNIGDSIQFGFTSNYTGGGTIHAVQTTLDSVPSTTIPDSGPFDGFMLNTGNYHSCPGFMQVGIIEWNGIAWTPFLMNGDSRCGESNMAITWTINTSDKMNFTMTNYGTLTEYRVSDTTQGLTVAQNQTALSTWPRNNFQTMTESTSGSTSVGSTNYDNSLFVDSNNNKIYVDSTNPSVSTPSNYGGACTLTAYTYGSWQNSPTYGFSEPAVNADGYCDVSNVYGYSGGSVNNPAGVLGGPDNDFTQLYAGNSGDTAFVDVNFGKSYTGNLYLDGYSYNNGHGGYISQVAVWVSPDNSHWTLLYNQYWDPSSTNTPSWINLGSVTNEQYAYIEALDGGTYSANVYLDSARMG